MAGSYDFKIAQQLANSGPPFDALIMAAVLRADSANLAQLRAAFPELVTETADRYNAPGSRGTA